MTKFKNLHYKEKLSNYRRIVKFPTLILLFILTAYEINYLIICSIFVATMIGDLLFYGVLAKDRKYTYSSLMTDALILYAVNFLATVYVTPNVSNYIVNFNAVADNPYIFNIIISLAFIYLFWFVVLLVQKSLSNNKNNWKWKASGLFNSTLKASFLR
ncbi:hypothetical protein SAMN04488100_1447 [Alkalibacterium putridalgicola]|uniref:Uncharacterized protein n=1 Tax=Alkalibacterium putridalgicola TaxID=426703 RepID=A0A1H7X278_9LACT|nr:hypothetical protein [Alkalibacterium putridalgicola]GEK90227.1 hypothetical protein APU01nite_22660 [Alkalibacterium putridalgicola]SEM27960.1 hypothetical protein SAMN04488100_1447 [Alkalibacterium putridalgicola]